MKNTRTKLISIVPLVPIPIGKSPFFSYATENKEVVPSSGSIVSIPFGRRTVRGVVWREPPTSNPIEREFRYKPVIRTISEDFLSKPTFAFARSLSLATNTPLGSMLERFVPTKFAAPFSGHSLLEKPRQLPPQTHNFAPEEARAAAKIQSRRKKSTLFLSSSSSEKIFVLFDCVRKSVANGGTALVLVPDASILSQEKNRYSNEFGSENISTFHSGLKDSEKSIVREQARTGTIPIIIGTPAAALLPFLRLDLIIEDDADALPYETTRISLGASVRQTLHLLSLAHKSTLIRASSSPSMSSMEDARKSKSLVELKKEQETPIPLSIINLRIERWKKKLSPISEPLRFAISDALSKKQQILLVVCRSGMSAFSICSDCRHILRCRTCGRSLDYQKSGEYQCPSCRSSAGTTPRCASCGSIVFKQIGFGSERVERDLKRNFPGAKTVRYDSKSAKGKLTLEELESFRKGNRDILITTEKGVFGWDLPKLSLVAIMDADSALGAPRWDADERAFRLFLSAVGRARRQKDNSQLAVIQTFHPENSVFEYLSKGELRNFFSSIEEERRSLLFPPFGKIVRISIDPKKKIEAESAFEKLKEFLDLERKKSPKSIRFSISSRDRIRKPSLKGSTRGKIPEREAIVRYSAESAKEFDFEKSFERFLQGFPGRFNIERQAD